MAALTIQALAAQSEEMTTPTCDTRAAGLVALRLGGEESLPGRLYGQNVNLVMEAALQGINNGGPQLEEAVRAQRPHGLRFPAGTLANNYLWKDDSFSEAKNDLTGWAGQQIELFRKLGAKHDLPGFARICVRENLEPI